MSKKIKKSQSVYETQKGKQIFNPESFYIHIRSGKEEKTSVRYMLIGTNDKGKKAPIFVSKEVAERYGEPKFKETKPREPKAKKGEEKSKKPKAKSKAKAKPKPQEESDEEKDDDESEESEEETPVKSKSKNKKVEEESEESD